MQMSAGSGDADERQRNDELVDDGSAMRKLTIQHVLRGCHTWANGTKRSATMQMTIRAGGKQSILNQDLDAHQLVFVSGLSKLHLGGPMMMNQSRALSFAETGIYRFRTKTVEMPGGMEVEAKTIGPDNTLRLVVTVV